MYNLQKLCEIESEEIIRIPTTFRILDEAFGKSVVRDFYGDELLSIGLPRGMTSIWAGEPGVGKSRLCTTIGANICTHYGFRTLYIINEDTAQNLRRWTPIKAEGIDEFFVASGCSSLEEQCDLIEENLPDLVIIDSLNMVANIRSPEDIKHAMQKWKDATQKAQCHTILIAHMNKAGEIKGTTDIPHLADMTCFIRKLDVPKDMKKYREVIEKSGYFIVETGKNRYGPSGSKICFQHQENGVIYKASDLAG